jgi:hypothetical protein
MSGSLDCASRAAGFPAARATDAPAGVSETVVDSSRWNMDCAGHGRRPIRISVPELLNGGLSRPLGSELVDLGDLNLALDEHKLQSLRQRVTESLRIQWHSVDAVPYIDAANVVGDVCARQNHAIFARRGCGKTLLLHDSSRKLDRSIRTVYLNCEDFKRHSFPNVLIEILDALFRELETHLTGWVGRKRRSRELVKKIRADLSKLRTSAERKLSVD